MKNINAVKTKSIQKLVQLFFGTELALHHLKNVKHRVI